MSDAEQLVAAVRARTEGSPYVVTETPQGFDVQIDIENATWFALLYKKHLDVTWIYHVAVDEGSKTLSITDDVRSVNWRAGAGLEDGTPVPTLGGTITRDIGRIESKGFQKTFGVSEQGRFEKVVDYRFDAAESRNLIREPARELGWTEKMGNVQKVGVYIAVGTIALLVLAGIIVGIVALAGGL